MKQLLQQYAAYNIWANEIITSQLITLGNDLVHKEIVSSFSSLYKTLLHMMEVENVWKERMLAGMQSAGPGWFKGNLAELCQKLLVLSGEWLDFVTAREEALFTAPVTYKNLAQKQFTEPLNHILIHLFNHQTYHRGQLVTMLRQCGVQNIKSTDYINYIRLKASLGN